MRHQSFACLTALLLVTGYPLSAQTPVHACTLLTAAEVTAATGSAVGRSTEMITTIPSGPSQGEKMYGCMWGTADRGMVNISVTRAPKGAQREAGLAKMRQAFDALKAKGWTEEKKD